MNLVIKPLLLMEHNWIETIGPVQASVERAPRPGSDNEAGLVNETSGAHYQRSLPCLWRSPPWALEISALACSPELFQFYTSVQKERECASRQLSVSTLNAPSQSNVIQSNLSHSTTSFISICFFSEESLYALHQESLLDFVWRGLLGLHLWIKSRFLFISFLPASCSSFPPFNGMASFREFVPEIIICSATTLWTWYIKH